MNEPLCQSQSLAYLRALASRGYRSCLITFERSAYAMTSSAAADVTRRLGEDGICWHPLKYHSRRNMAVAMVDAFGLVATTTLALVRHRPRIVHTRTSVPAVIGLGLATLFKRRFLYDADAELATEYVDDGHWSRGSLAYKILSFTERLCRDRADAMVVLTERLRSDLVAEGVRTPIVVIPCCVDAKRFQFDDAARGARRREIGVGENEKVLVYLGKTGPRYMLDETMAFAAVVRQQVQNLRLLVVTHEEPAIMQAMAARHGLEPALIVRRADYDEVPSWLSAGDAGLSLIRGAASRRGTSPIKISEYLAAGLPVVTTPSIGDISRAVETEDLGVVIRDQRESTLRLTAVRLRQLWADPAPVRRRCAAWARATVDVESIGATRYSNLYSKMLGDPNPIVGMPSRRDVSDE